MLDSSNKISKRLTLAVSVLILLIFVGTFGFYAIGKFYLPSVIPKAKSWSFLDCLYMVFITVTTTGYGEILPYMNLPLIRIYTSVLLLLSLGVYFYVGASMTTFFVEDVFSQMTKRRKMDKKIKKIKNHIIVCGFGSTGFHIVKELLITKWPMVVIEQNEEIIKKMSKELEEYGEILYITGDALEESVLKKAGIENAYGLMTALSSDKDNLFITITARQMNPNIRIVARTVDLGTSKKIKVAGANSVVSTNYIGGLRMVSEMIRPQVVEFLDFMLRDKEKNLRLEEIVIPENSEYDGKTIEESQINIEGKVVIIAIKEKNSKAYFYGPSPDFVLRSGMITVLMGDPDSVVFLRKKIMKMDTSKDN